MLVAAERPFREVVGVDLSAELVEIARAERRHHAGAPERASTHARQWWATPPTTRFRRETWCCSSTTRSAPPSSCEFLATVERALEAEQRAIYIIYYNPVHGALYDAAPFLTRRWARMLPYASGRASAMVLTPRMPW